MKQNNNRLDRGKNKKTGNVVESSAANRDRLAKELRLKPKSKAVLDTLIENKGITQTEAYMLHHPKATRKTAGVKASELVNKGSARIYTQAAVGKAKKRIVSLVDSSNESIALKASQDIVDRTEGKAVQKNESTVKTVEVRLDLTGLRSGSHYGKPVVTLPE